MVWPFSSSKPDNSKAASSSSSSTISDAIDSLENAGQDAKAAFESTKASIEDIVSASSPSIEAVQQQLTYIPESAKPYLITSTVFGVSLLAVVFYKNRLRRIPTAAYLTPNMLKGKRVMKGKVTSVGDADNFRFYHTPGGILAGWGWLRHVPTVAKELKDQTLHIRIAGVDAPEGAHFGMPAQPFSRESLEWLRKEIKGKTVVVQPFAKDRYDRVVAMAWYPRFLSFLPKKNVSIEMLKSGYGQIYRQAGSEYGDILDQLEKTEAKAKKQKIGIWSQKDMVSAAEHKKQYLRGGE